MNVLNQLDSESSSDSDGNAMEDRVAVEDGGHSENEWTCRIKQFLVVLV